MTDEQPDLLEVMEGSILHRHFMLGPGDICQCRASGPTHVVVRWERSTMERRVIYPRDEFLRDFVEIEIEKCEQPDLFGEEAPDG